MYETLEARQAVIHMPASMRLQLLLQHTAGNRDHFDNLALQALRAEIDLENLARTHRAFLGRALLSAHKVRDAFHAISWNVKHYPFVKPHHEHCIGFGTILKDGRPFELSGSMCCPGDHCDLSADEVKSLVEQRLAEARQLLDERHHEFAIIDFAPGGTDHVGLRISPLQRRFGNRLDNMQAAPCC